MSKTKELVDIDIHEIHAETENAYCISIDEDQFGKDAERIWLPKSQCEITDKVATMPEWLAIEKGLV